MSAAKHTQGPLQVLDHPQDGVFILDAGSRTLAKVVYLLNPNERMANAHLFAAAPELFEELSMILQSIEGGGDVVTFNGVVVARYRALIDKAQGGAA